MPPRPSSRMTSYCPIRVPGAGSGTCTTSSPVRLDTALSSQPSTADAFGGTRALPLWSSFSVTPAAVNHNGVSEDGIDLFGMGLHLDVLHNRIQNPRASRFGHAHSLFFTGS